MPPQSAGRRKERTRTGWHGKRGCTCTSGCGRASSTVRPPYSGEVIAPNFRVETLALAKRRQRGVMPASQPATVPCPKITIVGSGLAGPLMACYLGQVGFAVDLYEKRPD